VLTYFNGVLIMALYGILDAIKDKPRLFGMESVEIIFHFISGYQSATSEHQISDDDLEHFNLGFLPWVRESFPASPTHASWQSLILLYSTSKVESVEIFFSLLDKYRLSSGRELTDPQSRFIRLSMDDMPS
jgi:hypothetical protein